MGLPNAKKAGKIKRAAHTLILADKWTALHMKEDSFVNRILRNEASFKKKFEGGDRYGNIKGHIE